MNKPYKAVIGFLGGFCGTLAGELTQTQNMGHLGVREWVIAVAFAFATGAGTYVVSNDPTHGNEQGPGS